MAILPKYRTVEPVDLELVSCSHKGMVKALTRLYEVMKHMDDIESRMDVLQDEIWRYQDKGQSVPDGLSLQMNELGILMSALADERQRRFAQIGYVFTLDVIPPHVRRLKLIERAKDLQLEDEPNRDVVAKIHRELVQELEPHDGFWARWLYFAEQNGVEA